MRFDNLVDYNYICVIITKTDFSMKIKCSLLIAAIFSLFGCDNMLDTSILDNMGGGI